MTDVAPRGFDAYRAWRLLPKEVRKAFTTGQRAAPSHAPAALAYSHFALSPAGIALAIGPAGLILVGVSIAMSVLDIGPDGVDIAVFVGLFVVLTFSHFRTADRIRSTANSLLPPGT